MGFNLIKKHGVKTEEPYRLNIKSKASQAIDFILEKEKIDYKVTLRTILESLDYEEVEEVLTVIQRTDENKYFALLDASRDLRINNNFLKAYIHGFKTEIEDKFDLLYNDAKSSLSTGDLLAFLLKKYFHFKNKKLEVLKPATNDVLIEIEMLLIQNIALLKQEIGDQPYLPISKAIFVFLIYDKKEGLNKFKNIIRKNLEYKNHSIYQLEYFVTVDRFFDRLGLNYIPRIDTVSAQGDVVIAKKKISITKSIIYQEINKDDFFNNKIPLLNYNPKNLIIPRRNVRNLNRLTTEVSTLINVHNEDKNGMNGYDLGKVFIENITQPFPKYPDEILIRTREVIKDMLTNNSEFKLLFFAYLYTEKEADRIPGWTNKFPQLFNDYLGGLENLRTSSIKKYFFNDESNPANSYQKQINDFLEKHKS